MRHRPVTSKSPFLAAIGIIACTLGATLLTAPSSTRATAQPGNVAHASETQRPAVRTFHPTASPPTAVFPSRAADPAGATLWTDPIPNMAVETILQSQPIPRKTPIPFVRQAIPDPDDRANTPSLPVAPEAMPLMPKQ